MVGCPRVEGHRPNVLLSQTPSKGNSLKIYVTSLFVDDQDKAEKFYTEVLGFTVKNNIPLGDSRWLTVVSSEDPTGTELLLEPSTHRAVQPFKDALVTDGIPAHSFQVDALDVEWKRLVNFGVTFTQDPMDAGPVRMAVFDDTCGNLIQLIEMVDATD
jgi:catechol 2,3-dioxygenase-like lactoylglutathione lyase family enzyme